VRRTVLFRTRSALKKVPRLGPKAFELSAGFLRIRDGDDPLDTSGVHPEAYSVVRRILAANKSKLETLIGNTPALRQLEPEAFTDAVFGVPTVTDILKDPHPTLSGVEAREREQGVRTAPQAVRAAEKGSTRYRLPVAAKAALATAGPIGATPGSPTPVGASVEGTICTSTFGMSSMRRTW
jgi:hypothetical protein